MGGIWAGRHGRRRFLRRGLNRGCWNGRRHGAHALVTAVGNRADQGMAYLTQQLVRSAGANNMTGTATVLSAWVDMALLDELSLEIQATGTGTGTLTLEGTNQLDPSNAQQPNPSATWVPFASGASVPALSNPAGANLAQLVGLVVLGGQGSARFVRLRYVNASGAGKLDVYANGSGL